MYTVPLNLGLGEEPSWFETWSSPNHDIDMEWLEAFNIQFLLTTVTNWYLSDTWGHTTSHHWNQQWTLQDTTALMEVRWPPLEFWILNWNRDPWGCTSELETLIFLHDCIWFLSLPDIWWAIEMAKLRMLKNKFNYLFLRNLVSKQYNISGSSLGSCFCIRPMKSLPARS